MNLLLVDNFQLHFPEVPVTAEQRACCRFLEARGKVFMIDFGYETAPRIVWGLLAGWEPYPQTRQLDLFPSAAWVHYQEILANYA